MTWRDGGTRYLCLDRCRRVVEIRQRIKLSKQVFHFTLQLLVLSIQFLLRSSRGARSASCVSLGIHLTQAHFALLRVELGLVEWFVQA
jgi:hypothetical protein